MAAISKTAPETGALYGPAWYKVDERTMGELRRLDPRKPSRAAAVAWVEIALIVWGWGRLPYPWNLAAYPLAALFIAGRAGVFLQLLHEAAHGLVSKDSRFNDWFGRWVAGAPIGLDFEGYKRPHMYHHACTNQVCDPLSDSEKYRVVDARDPRLLLLFLKDIVGATAVAIRFMYDRPDINQRPATIPVELEDGAAVFSVMKGKKSRSETALSYAPIALWQLAILAALFQFNPVAYVALWLLPLLTAHMFLMRVRGIAEHGLGLQLGVRDLDQKNRGTFYTRSFGTPRSRYAFAPLNWLERALIGSLSVYYHHEHHLYPKVPYYNLARVHELVGERVARNNPFVYARGYFDCVFFNLRKRAESPDKAPALV